MKLPAYRAEAKPLPDIACAMGGDVVETLWHEGGYALIVYHSAEEVRALTPDLAALSEGDILYIATAPGTGDPSGADVVSRALDRKSTRLNSSHYCAYRMQSSA